MRMAASRPATPASAAPGTPPRHAVRVLGFSDFERHQLETVLRLSSRRQPAYQCAADGEPAALAVADAEHPAAREAVARLGLDQATLWVGDGTALPRPINVSQVVRALDAVALREPAPKPSAERVLAELALLRGAPAAEPVLRLVVASTDPRLLPPLAEPLRRAGCLLQAVRSGAEAIECASPGGRGQPRTGPATEHLPLAVVLDTRDDGAFGYLAARTIRQRAQAAGRPAPTIVLLADGALAVARVRAELAGADALLPLPVSAEELLERLPIMAACPSASSSPASTPLPSPPAASPALPQAPFAAKP
jgi:CheY-like chemotaxis protein